MNYNCCDGYKASSKITSGDGAPVKDCTSQDGDLYLDLKSRNMYIYTHGQWALLPDNRALGGSRVFITDMEGKELHGGTLISGPAHDGNFISQPYDIIMRVDNKNIMFLEQIDAHDFKLIYYFSPLAALNDIKTIQKLSEKVSIQDENGDEKATLGGLVDSVNDLSSKKIKTADPIKLVDDANTKGQQNLSLNLPQGTEMASMKTLVISPQDSPFDKNVTMYSVLNRVAFFHKKDAFDGQGHPSPLYIKPLTNKVITGLGAGIASMVDFTTGTTTPTTSSGYVMQCMTGRGIVWASSFFIFYNYDLRLQKLVVSVLSDQTIGLKITPDADEALHYPSSQDIPS